MKIYKIKILKRFGPMSYFYVNTFKYVTFKCLKIIGKTCNKMDSIGLPAK